jgi:SAM-dependent methyltransferase
LVQTQHVQPEDRPARETFDAVPDVYERVRPRYPAAMFADLFALLPAHPHVLEVGPGTGKATRDLLDFGATVHAIEIGPAMAEKLRDVVPSRSLTVTVGNFEDVPVDERHYDCVFSATAYHWIAPTAQLERPAALLKPRGLVAIVDLIQVDSPNDHGFFAAAQQIYERYSEGHTGPPAPRREEVEGPIRAELEADDRFEHVGVRRYDWDQTYTASQYRELMVSYSPTLLMEPRARQGLLDDMEAFVKEHFASRVVRPLVAALTTATLAA